MDFSTIPTLLQSLIGAGEGLLVRVRGLLFFDNIGSTPVMGGIQVFMILAGIALGSALAFHVAQVFLEWVKWRKISDRSILEVFKIVMFAAAAGFFYPWATTQIEDGKINTGSVAGISYRSISDQVQVGAAQATAALRSVSIVEQYVTLLQERNAGRREKILDAIAEQNPSFKGLVELHRQKVPRKSEQGVVSDVSGWWKRTRATVGMGTDLLWQSITQGDSKDAISMVTVFVKALANALTFFFFMAISWLAFAFFAFGVIKAVIIFALYLKIGIFFGFILLPPMIALAYFQSMRGFAIAMARNVIVLIILATAYSNCYRVIFSQDNIQHAAELAMATSVSSTQQGTAPITREEIMALKVDLIHSSYQKTDVNDPDALSYYATLSPAMSQEVATAVAKACVALGMMAVLLGKLYEIISGAMEGGYDPTDLMRQQAQEAASAARR